MLTDIWDEFMALLKDGSLAAARIRPYHESLQESLQGSWKPCAQRQTGRNGKTHQRFIRSAARCTICSP